MDRSVGSADDVAVRLAVSDEAEAVARVHLRCWREAYAHLLSDAFFTTLEAGLGKRAQRMEQGIDDGRALWIAERSGQIVGLARATEHSTSAPTASADDEVPAALELATIYVLADQYGSGAGQMLLDVTIGDLPCFLWVAEDNPRARSFYTRNGFRADGARKVESAWEAMPVVRLVRP